MSNRKTKGEKLCKELKDQGVKFVRLEFTDILGIPKDVELTIDELPKAFEEGIPFDGSSIEGFARISESDMYLRPDPDTVIVYPWESSTTEGEEYHNAGVICDVFTPEGEPFRGDPRWVLKQAMKDAEEEGYKMFVGPEPEFFLFSETEDLSPVLHDDGSYFDLVPIDKGEKTRKEVITSLEKIGFQVETAHHEVAPSQHEIDFQYDEALKIADQIMNFRTTTKTIALFRDLQATFMPKPLSGENGSGMHTHISLFSNGKNIFYKDSNPYKLSDKGLHFIGGLIEHIEALTAVTNPTVNSYKRLVPGYEAPVNISWGRVNRSALIRIPSTNTPKESTRVELRSPDPSANPYLAFAAIFKAGLHGIEEKIDPPNPVDEDIYKMSSSKKREMEIDSLPQSLGRALDALENDQLIQEALGPHITEKFIRAKREEEKEYMTSVGKWELKKYMSYY